MRKQFLWFMCLRSLHVTSVFSILPLCPCAPFPLSYSCSKTPNFKMDFFRYLFLQFAVDSLDHQCFGCSPRPAFPFVTVPTISFILRADSAFSTAIFAFNFRPVITEGWAFFTSGLRESCSIWKSRTFPNLYSSTCDNVGTLFC